MDEAATTWALVVGIDKYDKPELLTLQGAVADAVAAVRWLRRLQVPADQILLHLAPEDPDRQDVADPGIAYQAARKDDLVQSVNRLRNVRGGTRLFVFLCGHGLYEPSHKRLFLPQNAGVGDIWYNLGLEAYCDLFRTMAFRRQFLVMDGCLNYPYPDNVRPRIDAEGFPGLAPQTPKPGVGLVACYAAAQDQRATEVEGRGAFMRRLLAGLDLDNPAYPEAVMFDFSTGTRTLDIRSLVLKWAAPTVTSDVHKGAGLVQTPQLEALGAAQGQDVLPVCRMPDLEPPPSRIELSVDPPQAARDVTAMRVATQRRPWWSITIPVPPEVTVQVPVVARLPRNMPAQVICEVSPGAPWDVSKAFLELPTDRDGRFAFQFLPRPAAAPAADQPGWGADLSFGGDAEPGAPAPEGAAEPGPPEDGVDVFSVQAVTVEGAGELPETVTEGPGGPGMDEAVEAGVVRQRHAGRTEFLVRPHARARGAALALRTADAMAEASPPDVGVLTVLRGDTPPLEMPNVRILPPEGGVEHLAGLLADRRLLLWIGRPGQREDEGRRLRLRDVGEGLELRSQTGPVELRLQLPWGSWTYTGFAPSVGQLTVQLPASVGIPPLRVSLYEEVRRFSTNRRARLLGVIAAGAEPPEGHAVRGLDGQSAARLRPTNPGAATWALAIPQDLEAAAPLAFLELAPTLALPLPPDRDIALDLTAGVRVEPFSEIDAPEWDLLVATGRLDALSPDEVTDLSRHKWVDPLLGLAGGYATWSLQAWRHVEIIVGNLQNLARAYPWPNLQPDLDLLRGALEQRTHGRPGGPTLQALDGHARAGAVPYLRWGVRLALDLLEGADQPALARWRSKLAEVGRTLSPISVWTAWII